MFVNPPYMFLKEDLFLFDPILKVLLFFLELGSKGGFEFLFGLGQFCHQSADVLVHRGPLCYTVVAS